MFRNNVYKENVVLNCSYLSNSWWQTDRLACNSGWLIGITDTVYSVRARRVEVHMLQRTTRGTTVQEVL